MIDCLTHQGNLFTGAGDEILPDEKGIITVKIDGVERRFVKDKFINWLSQNNIELPAPKKKPERKTRERKERPLKYKKSGKKYIRTVKTPRKGTKIIAINNSKDVFGPFISLSACANELKLNKSHISRTLKGFKTQHKGFKFQILQDAV